MAAVETHRLMAAMDVHIGGVCHAYRDGERKTLCGIPHTVAFFSPEEWPLPKTWWPLSRRCVVCHELTGGRIRVRK